MAMSTGKRLAVTGLLVAAFGGALFYGLRGHIASVRESLRAAEGGPAGGQSAPAPSGAPPERGCGGH